MEEQALLKRFKIVSYAEGISFLLLLGIAMPLKYMGNIPEAVKYTGWAHGVLFVAYCLFLVLIWQEYKWKFGKLFLAFIAALLPFGPFVFHKKMAD